MPEALEVALNLPLAWTRVKTDINRHRVLLKHLSITVHGSSRRRCQWALSLLSSYEGRDIRQGLVPPSLLDHWRVALEMGEKNSNHIVGKREYV